MGANETRSSHQSRRALISILAIVTALIFLGSTARAESFTDASRGDFLQGTLQDTRVTPDGRVELAPGPGVWSKQGIALDVGPPGSPDSVWARNPTILRETNQSYRMWYCGYDGSRSAILLATSTDGNTWTKRGIVLATFDSICTPNVLREGTTYHMWFQAGPSGGGSIDHTTSVDGTNWSAPEVALSPGGPGSWDGLQVGHPFVVRDAGGVYRLYYVGTEGTTDQVGLARSSSYANFTRVRPDPVLPFGVPGRWDGEKVRIGSVLPPSPASGFPWTMYYAGLSGGIWKLGFAFSEDGVTWIRSSQGPFLAESLSGFDSVALISASFLNTGSQIRLYYTASDGSTIRIAFAAKNAPEFTFVPSGTFISRVFDSGTNSTTWRSAIWNAVFPAGSSGVLWVRIANTSGPGAAWSPWIRVTLTAGNVALLASLQSRYIQYRADLSLLSAVASPEIVNVTMSTNPQSPLSPTSDFAGLYSLLIVVGLVGAVAVVYVVLALLTLRPGRPP